MKKSERVAGHVFRLIGDDGQTKGYQFRRLVPIFENGIRKYQNVRRKLSRNIETATPEARKYDEEIEALLRGERPRRKITIGQFFDWYINRVRNERRLYGAPTISANCSGLVQYVGPGTLLDKVTRDNIERFLEERRRTVRPETVFTQAGTIRTWFAEGVRFKFIAHSPAEGVKIERPPKREVRLPTPEETRRVLDYLGSKDRALYRIVLALVFTGARLSEILGVDWRQVDFTSTPPRLTLSRRKVNDELTLPLAVPLHNELFELWMASGTPKQGKVFQPERADTDRDGPYRRFKGAVKQLGLAWLDLKRFRATAATWAAQATGGSFAPQMLLGHTTSRTTERSYLQGGSQARETAVKAIEVRLGLPIADELTKKLTSQVTEEIKT
jgi:integrase